jgi:GNAT superfamily N-acetyltransferase
LLIAVRPDYQDKGIPSMIFAEQLPYYKQYGVKLLETTSILETNNKNLANFTILPHKQHRRRRAYINEI